MCGKNSSEPAAKRWLLAWLPFWIYSALVLKSAVAQPQEIPSFFLKINDKLVHGVEYFFLFWFSLHAFQKAKGQALQTYAARWAVIYSLAMGMMTEILQLFVPHRSCDFWDGMADTGGVGLALAVYATVAKRFGRKNEFF